MGPWSLPNKILWQRMDPGPMSVGKKVPEERIAYLTGEYPKVSHTFIQREIAAFRQEAFHSARDDKLEGISIYADAVFRDLHTIPVPRRSCGTECRHR